MFVEWTYRQHKFGNMVRIDDEGNVICPLPGIRKDETRRSFDRCEILHPDVGVRARRTSVTEPWPRIPADIIRLIDLMETAVSSAPSKSELHFCHVCSRRSSKRAPAKRCSLCLLTSHRACAELLNARPDWESGCIGSDGAIMDIVMHAQFKLPTMYSDSPSSLCALCDPEFGPLIFGVLAAPLPG